MTARNILADRLVERVFKKKRAAPVMSEAEAPNRPLSVTLRLEDARNQRIRREQMLKKFEEF